MMELFMKLLFGFGVIASLLAVLYMIIRIEDNAIKIKQVETQSSDRTREHLLWIYSRLIEVHGENPNIDYMIRFKQILDKEI
jgi:hypothetical protein